MYKLIVPSGQLKKKNTAVAYVEKEKNIKNNVCKRIVHS